MKYETELLAEIIANRGHEKSSIHYESECKEAFIEECKGSYPKLCDYESEWLNYMVENPIGEFPYETITNVTEATINNVVPFAFKSAILKGQTLVNIKGEESNDVPIGGYSSCDFLIPLVKKNTDYLIKYDTTLSGGALAIGFLNNSGGWSNNLERQPNIGLIRLNSGEYPIYFRIIAGGGQTVAINNLMIIEYQEDMENWNIPYFEGMQSVKMPVLTTTGKNLNPTGIEPLGIYDSTGVGNGDLSQCRTDDFINVIPNQVLTVSSDQQINRIFGYDADENYLGLSNGGIIFSYNSPNKKEHTFTVPNNCHKIKITSFVNTNAYFQLEEGTIATSYEPYKSNILTVNEDVTLRGIGNVKDELDCLTGEVTERIEEIVLDGGDDEEWITSTGGSDTHQRFVLKRGNRIKPVFNVNHNKFLCDKFKTVNDITGVNSQEMCLMESHDDWYVSIIIDNTKLNSNTVDGFKSWLQSNKVKIQYVVESESIKTVDLSIVNQDGQSVSKLRPFEGTMHMVTDGQPLKPLLSAEVPVEAITQNLASFINEE